MSTLWSIFLTIVWIAAGLMFIVMLYQMIRGLISPAKLAGEREEVETRKAILGSHLVTDVTHPLNNVLYSQDVAPRMGFVIPLTLQIMVVD